MEERKSRTIDKERIRKGNEMQDTKCILDDICDYISRFVVYPNQHAKVAHTLWLVGSYFLEYEGLSVFDNYPILAFLSPDEDSGKTRALDITELLAYTAINGGSYTAAGLCREIDQRYPTLVTMILDELDETLSPGKDNSDYIRLLNNGYQRGKYIVRCNLNDNSNLRTPAYCPKAIAGLTTTKLKKTTRSRMITNRMRPLRTGEQVERHIDKAKGNEIVAKIIEWRPTVLDQLKNTDEDSLSTLTNRSAQIWHPLLAIAKIAGEDWYKRGSAAADFFVSKQKPEDTLGKKIFAELFRAYALYSTNQYPKGIQAQLFSSELKQRDGFPDDIDSYKIAYYLGANGYGIPIEQVKYGRKNLNGYKWDSCMPFFADYLTEEQRDQIWAEVKEENEAKKVGRVEVSRGDVEKEAEIQPYF